jgi:PAS domain S-box-containing protein
MLRLFVLLWARAIHWMRAWVADLLAVAADGIALGIVRKRAEEAARADEARVRAAFETAADGIVTISERGVIEALNSATLRLFGYTSEELVGQNVNTLMPALTRACRYRRWRRYSCACPNLLWVLVEMRVDGEVWYVLSNLLPGTSLLRAVRLRKQRWRGTVTGRWGVGSGPVARGAGFLTAPFTLTRAGSGLKNATARAASRSRR